MYRYFIKKLGHQELGSINSEGIPQRGRYIFVSKNHKILSIFPHLSEVVVNDSALLPILAIYSGEKVYCNYIYHNDKISRPGIGTRDEYRIYLNKGLDSRDKIFYKEGDYIIIRKFEKPSDGIDEINESFYVLDYIKSSENYIADLLSELQPLRANSGQYYYEGYITEFENKLSKLSSRPKAVIDEKVTEEIKTEEQHGKDISSLFSAQSFRDFVLAGYNYKCAITGINISYKDLFNIEAAHIMPRSHSGLFLPNNGIALSRDMHWAFDKGFFTITKELTVKVHPDIDSEFLKRFDGKKIFVPQNSFFAPDVANLKYHQDHIYGLFKTTGRL